MEHIRSMARTRTRRCDDQADYKNKARLQGEFSVNRKPTPWGYNYVFLGCDQVDQACIQSKLSLCTIPIRTFT